MKQTKGWKMVKQLWFVVNLETKIKLTWNEGAYKALVKVSKGEILTIPDRLTLNWFPLGRETSIDKTLWMENKISLLYHIWSIAPGLIPNDYKHLFKLHIDKGMRCLEERENADKGKTTLKPQNAYD